MRKTKPRGLFLLHKNIVVHLLAQDTLPASTEFPLQIFYVSRCFKSRDGSTALPFPSPPLPQNLKTKFGSLTSGPVLKSACIFVLRVINALHLLWPQGLADLSVAEQF